MLGNPQQTDPIVVRLLHHEFPATVPAEWKGRDRYLWFLRYLVLRGRLSDFDEARDGEVIAKKIVNSQAVSH